MALSHIKKFNTRSCIGASATSGSEIVVKRRSREPGAGATDHNVALGQGVAEAERSEPIGVVMHIDGNVMTRSARRPRRGGAAWRRPLLKVQRARRASRDTCEFDP